MDRNPNAFRPKIHLTVQDGDGASRHHKGCHCKKSNCLKKLVNNIYINYFFNFILYNTNLYKYIIY